MKLGDLYGGTEGRQFKVTELELRDTDPWVTYINTQTEQEYSCRQEAFLSRFSPLPN
jgi:hypothetical protein